jgi:hypothetical protein
MARDYAIPRVLSWQNIRGTFLMTYQRQEKRRGNVCAASINMIGSS